MKTLLFISIALMCMQEIMSQATGFNVYVKNGTQNIKEIKAGDLGELWVTVPVPNDVGNYDRFIVLLCFGDCGFNKTASYIYNKDFIQSTLSKKSTIDLLIINNSEPRKSTFADAGIVYNDLFVFPRNQGLERLKVLIKTQVQSILRWEKETIFDESTKKYIEQKKPIFSNVKEMGQTEFYTILPSLNEGVADINGIMNILLPNPGKSKFSDWTRNDDSYKSRVMIKDNSRDFEILIKIFAFEKPKFSIDKLLSDFMAFAKSLNAGQLRWDLYTYEKLGKRSDFNKEKKLETFSDFSLSKLSGKTMQWYSPPSSEKKYDGFKPLPGAYSRFYFYEKVNYNYMAYVQILEVLSEEGKQTASKLPIMKMKPEWFSFSINPDAVSHAEKVIEKLISNSEFK
jgi:hypothetical protein